MGGPTRRIRDELWTKALKKIKDGTVTQLWTARTEQGFAYRQHGLKNHLILDFEGLHLVGKVLRPKRKPKADPPPPDDF